MLMICLGFPCMLLVTMSMTAYSLYFIAMGAPNMIVYMKNNLVISSVQGAEIPGVYLVMT